MPNNIQNEYDNYMHILQKLKREAKLKACSDAKPLLPTGAKRIKFRKPNLTQRLIYWIGLIKDPRYNGEKNNYYHLDEVGQMSSKYL